MKIKRASSVIIPFLLLITLCGLALGQKVEPISEDLFYQMTTLAPAEYSRGDLDEAGSIANRLLKEAPNWEKNWNYGNAIHAANIVLGRISLVNGDVKVAGKYLLASANIPGSPQLNSFGPDMTLAAELLAKGENEIVLKYFGLCAKFWSPKFSKLDIWREDVMAGNMPNFGANLRYLGF